MGPCLISLLGQPSLRVGPSFLNEVVLAADPSSVCLIHLRGQELVFVFSGLLPHLRKGHTSSTHLRTLLWMKLSELMCPKGLFVSLWTWDRPALHPVLQGPPLSESNPGVAHPAGVHLLILCPRSDPV